MGLLPWRDSYRFLSDIKDLIYVNFDELKMYITIFTATTIRQSKEM